MRKMSTLGLALASNQSKFPRATTRRWYTSALDYEKG